MAIKYQALIVLLFIGSTALRAQYLPLLASGNEWSNVEIHCQPQGNSYTSSRLVIGRDTIFDNVSFQTIWSTSQSSPLYYGAMREDPVSGEVWYRYPYSPEEGLVYNFDLQPGDTARLVNQLFGMDVIGLVVIARDSVFMNNQWRVRLTLTNFELSLQEWWIEGIGSSWGLLNAGNSFYAAACGGQELLCFWENGVQVFQNPVFPTCDFTPTGEKEIGELLDVSVFPNPVSHTLFLRNSPPDAVVSLYASDGAVVLRSNAGDPGQQLNVSHLPVGLYLLTVVTHRQLISRRVIISR